jgi:hypothetical protein
MHNSGRARGSRRRFGILDLRERARTAPRAHRCEVRRPRAACTVQRRAARLRVGTRTESARDRASEGWHPARTAPVHPER